MLMFFFSGCQVGGLPLSVSLSTYHLSIEAVRLLWN